MIGLLLILITAAGYGVYTQDQDMARKFSVAAVVYIAFLLLIQSPWQMWRDTQREIAGFKERLRPRLSFVFEPDIPPYLHHFRLQEPGKFDRRVRIYRIGIRNDSAVMVKKARVVVEFFDFIRDGQHVAPSPNQPGLVEHALNVMGIDRKDGRVDIAPGDRPTAYIDVVEQMRVEGKPSEPWMSMCYATGHRTLMTTTQKWVIGLRVESGKWFSRASVAVEGTGDDHEIVMRLHALG